MTQWVRANGHQTMYKNSKMLPLFFQRKYSLIRAIASKFPASMRVAFAGNFDVIALHRTGVH